jgi:hypothetical protein
MRHVSRTSVKVIFYEQRSGFERGGGNFMNFFAQPSQLQTAIINPSHTSVFHNGITLSSVYN